MDTSPTGNVLKLGCEDYVKPTEIADLRKEKCVKLNFSIVIWRMEDTSGRLTLLLAPAGITLHYPVPSSLREEGASEVIETHCLFSRAVEGGKG